MITFDFQCVQCKTPREVTTGNSRVWYEKRFPICRKCSDRNKQSSSRDLGRRFVWRFYRRNAATRKLGFGLDFDGFVTLIEGSCFYCGEAGSNAINMDEWKGYKIGLGKLKKYRSDLTKYLYNGIDRSDNNLGYVKDNCVSCCKVCNRAKADMSREDFIGWIERLRKSI